MVCQFLDIHLLIFLSKQAQDNLYFIGKKDKGIASARTSGGTRASGRAQSRQINCGRQMRHCSVKKKSRKKIPSQHQTILHAT
jgi:hypothetical protein